MEITAAIVLFLVLTILVIAFRKKKVDSNTLQDWANIVTISSVISAIVVGIIFYLLSGLVFTPEAVPTPLPSMVYPIETNLTQDTPITPSTYPSVPTPMGRFHQIQLDGKIKSGIPQASYQLLYYVDNDENNKELLAHAVSPHDGLVAAISVKFSQAITIQIEPVDGTVWHIKIKIDGEEKSADTVNGETTFQVQ